jgi:hypothetical protein
MQYVPKRLERFQAAITALEMHAEVYFPHETKQQVFKFWSYAQSHYSLSLGPSRYKDKMATRDQKAFWVLQFAKHESVVSVQGAFRRQFQSDLPSVNSIRLLHQLFHTTGSLCKGKISGRPRVSEEIVERARQSFLPSPKKSVRHASLELEMSTMTVWKMFRKRL